MRFGRISGTLVLVGLLFYACSSRVDAASSSGIDADPAVQIEASALRAAAASLDRAASAGRVPVASDEPRLASTLRPWLAAGLGAARKEKTKAARVADVRALAASLRTEADLAARTPSAAPGHLAADVRQVLAEPDFRQPARSGATRVPQQSWFERMWTSFLDWWSRLLSRAFFAAASVPAIGNLVAFALIAAASIALAFLVFRIARYVVVRRAKTSRSTFAGTPLIAHADAEDTYRAARAAARGGSYGLAIALIFEAALLALDHSGRVPYDSARTAGEYRRAVRRSIAGAAPSFETLVQAFTYAAYAETPADESDWREADAAYASMSVSASASP